MNSRGRRAQQLAGEAARNPDALALHVGACLAPQAQRFRVAPELDADFLEDRLGVGLDDLDGLAVQQFDRGDATANVRQLCGGAVRTCRATCLAVAGAAGAVDRGRVAQGRSRSCPAGGRRALIYNTCAGPRRRRLVSQLMTSVVRPGASAAGPPRTRAYSSSKASVNDRRHLLAAGGLLGQQAVELGVVLPVPGTRILSRCELAGAALLELVGDVGGRELAEHGSRAPLACRRRAPSRGHACPAARPAASRPGLRRAGRAIRTVAAGPARCSSTSAAGCCCCPAPPARLQRPRPRRLPYAHARCR